MKKRMDREMIRTMSRRLLALALIPLLAAMFTLAAAEMACAGEGAETSVAVKAGGRYVDTTDNQAFTLPYDPLDSNAILGFDVLTVKPGAKSFYLEGGFMDEDDWDVRTGYQHGAAFSADVKWQKFIHNLDHELLPPDSDTPTPGYGLMKVRMEDRDPEGTYSNTFDDLSAKFKIRAPDYPAHIRGSGRIYTRQGPKQKLYYDRNCGGPLGCHLVSDERDVDQDTVEYTIGADAHLGLIDIMYERRSLTFEDQMPDPTDPYENFINGFYGVNRPAGDYTHAVYPDTTSFTDTVRINTNLVERLAATFTYIHTNTDNDDSGITRENDTLAGDVRLALSGRSNMYLKYRHRTVETTDVAPAALAIREDSRHSDRPERKEDRGEIGFRYQPNSKVLLQASVSHSNLQRKDADETELPEDTRTTGVMVRGELSPSDTVDLSAWLEVKDTSDPAYATDTTRLYTLFLEADWMPSPTVDLHLHYQGFTGENDDAASLQSSYDVNWMPTDSFQSDTSGHVITALLGLTPSEALRITALFSYSMYDMEQDMVFGSPKDAPLTFLAEDVPWEQNYYMVDLEAALKATDTLTLTAGGMYIAGDEMYSPVFPADEALEELSMVEFAKVLLTGGAVFALSETTDISAEIFWADFDDKEVDSRDGSAVGGGASISKRW